MKTKFKKGDKVKLITDKKISIESENWSKKDGMKKGNVYTVSFFERDGWKGTEDSIELEESRFVHPASKFKLATDHPLVITKQTKVRAGKKYYTWQFSKNKKVSNHQYNSAPGRNKQLNQFIEDIQNGNFEIK